MSTFQRLNTVLCTLIKSSGLQTMRLFYLFPVNLTVAGVWVKVPCVDDLGSCYHPDVCVRLTQLFKTVPELCPEPKRPSRVPCGCLFVSSFTEHPVYFISMFLRLTFICFSRGDYCCPSSGIHISNVLLPNRVTNFRLQIILGNF